MGNEEMELVADTPYEKHRKMRARLDGIEARIRELEESPSGTEYDAGWDDSGTEEGEPDWEIDEEIHTVGGRDMELKELKREARDLRYDIHLSEAVTNGVLTQDRAQELRDINDLLGCFWHLVDSHEIAAYAYEGGEDPKSDAATKLCQLMGIREDRYKLDYAYIWERDDDSTFRTAMLDALADDSGDDDFHEPMLRAVGGLGCTAEDIMAFPEEKVDELEQAFESAKEEIATACYDSQINDAILGLQQEIVCIEQVYGRLGMGRIMNFSTWQEKETGS